MVGNCWETVVRITTSFTKHKFNCNFYIKNNYFPFYFQIQKFYTCSNKLSKLRICDIDYEYKMSEKDKIIVLIIYENDK